jgi:CBS domain-containing protein
LVEEAAKAGVIHPEAGEIASRALDLPTLSAADVMVPRQDVVVIPRNASRADLRRVLLERMHTRIPVYEDRIDNIIGYISVKDMLAMANATFDRGLRSGPPNAETSVGVLSKMAIAGTTLGRIDATRFMIANQMKSLTAEREGAYNGGRPLRNRLSLREGHQAFDAQRLGRSAEALQIALLNSTPPAPGEESTIRVFAAWPPEWDATFTLRDVFLDHLVRLRVPVVGDLPIGHGPANRAFVWGTEGTLRDGRLDMRPPE